MSRNTIMTLALMAGVGATGGAAFAQTAPAPATPDAQAGMATPGMDSGSKMERKERKKDRKEGDRKMKGGEHRGGPAMGAMLGRFDTDGDGKVTQAEAEAGLAKMMKEYDADSDGVLSADEFASMQAALMRPMLNAQFSMLDANKDGKLEPAEATSRFGRMFANGPMTIPRPDGKDKDNAKGKDNAKSAPAAPSATPGAPAATAPSAPATPEAPAATPVPAN